jgi:hypothetical protein
MTGTIPLPHAPTSTMRQGVKFFLENLNEEKNAQLTKSVMLHLTPSSL